MEALSASPRTNVVLGQALPSGALQLNAQGSGTPMRCGQATSKQPALVSKLATVSLGWRHGKPAHPGNFTTGSGIPGSMCQRRQLVAGFSIRAAAGSPHDLWSCLHGADSTGKHWEGFLPKVDQPTSELHANLRKEILKYGDLTELTYDGFIGNVWESEGRSFGPRIEKPECFIESMDVPRESLVLEPQGYTAVRYIYARSGVFSKGLPKDSSGNWIGYVAVSKPLSDEGAEVKEGGVGGKVDVAIVFRGTILPEEWLTNVRGNYLRPWLFSDDLEKLKELNKNYAWAVLLTNIGGAISGLSALLHLGLTSSNALSTLAHTVGVQFFYLDAASCPWEWGGKFWIAVGALALLGISLFITGLYSIHNVGPMVHMGFQEVYYGNSTGEAQSEAAKANGNPIRGWIDDNIRIFREATGQEQPQDLKGLLSAATESQTDRDDTKSSPKQVIEKELSKLLEDSGGSKPAVRSITTAGHSLGGALAILAAAHVDTWMKEKFPNGPHPHVSAFTFAAPRVGNKGFVELFKGIPVLRVINDGDLVPKAPGLLWTYYATINTVIPTLKIPEWVFAFASFSSGVWAYSDDMGSKLLLHPAKSKVLQKQPLRPVVDAGVLHNLELYLWLVATLYGGQKEPLGAAGSATKEAFRAKDEQLRQSTNTERDYARMNMSDNCLSRAAAVPPAFYGPSPWTSLGKLPYGKDRFPKRSRDFEP